MSTVQGPLPGLGAGYIFVESLLYSEDKFLTFSASYLACTVRSVDLSRNGSEDFQILVGPVSPYSLSPLFAIHLCAQLYCIVAVSHRKLLPCLHLAPLLQSKFVLSQSLLVPIVFGYYQNFMSVIIKSSFLASQSY